ncbi:uncharacterized protein [Typha latifolia]|uniref:uncharacterized protein isoform X1 n=1 Tax=Typha latifolia TaxID=4733 RepID=UPI003C30E38B
MAESKLGVVSIVLFLSIVGIRAETELEGVVVADVSDLTPEEEIAQLKSKIASLDRSDELTRKDDNIAHLENRIKEKSANIASLESEIKLLQKKVPVDDEESLRSAQARNNELEKQIEKLKGELEIQSKKRETLEGSVSEAERDIEKLRSKLEDVEKIYNEQRNRIKKIEHAVRVAEDKLMGAQVEARSKAEELMKIHRAWLPHWLATHLAHFQDIASTKWDRHLKPAVDCLLVKAAEKLAKAQKLVEPHFETVKTEWIPALKDHWIMFTTSCEPYVLMASNRTAEAYAICRSTIKPHIVKVKELADPYFQEAKRFSEPYIKQIATVAKPYVEKVQLVIEPYKKHVASAFAKLLESASMYHHQVQDAVQENLKKHELSKPLATKRLVSIMVSALFAIPLFCLYKIFSTIFSKKIIRTTRNHASQRHKRRHVDK